MKEREFCEMSTMSSAELRKIRKPLIERKRRERINESLEQLKVLLLQTYNRHDPQYTKMEKADILEMAVEHLQYLRASQAARPPSAYELAQKYAAGFRECVTEVTRCITSFPEVKPDVRSRIMRHLNTYVDTMSACNGFLAATQQQPVGIPAPGGNQNQGYVLTAANQRQDFNGNVIAPADLARAQFSPTTLAAAPKNHVIHVPKPIKLEPYHYDSLSHPKTNLPGQTGQGCHIGDLKSIETARSRTDHIESPPEEASTSMQSNDSISESTRKRTHDTSEDYICVDAVSRKLDFEETDNSEPVAKRIAREHGRSNCSSSSVTDITSAFSVNAAGANLPSRKDSSQLTVNSNANNALRNDVNDAQSIRHERQERVRVGNVGVEDISDEEDEDMWRPW